jgi:HEAT repeat protein
VPDPRPKKKTPREIDVRSLARAYTPIAIQTLGGVAQNSESDGARVSAAIALLDRGWGKAAQPLTGAGGVEPIEVTIRTIIEGSKKK